MHLTRCFRWVWGLAIGVPVAAALAYILFGPDTQVQQNVDYFQLKI